MATVRFVPDRRNIDNLTTRNGIVGRSVERAGKVTVKRAKSRVNAYARVQTGYMRDSISAEFRRSSDTATVAISSRASYAIFQHRGTRFVSPAPFLTDAMRQLSTNDYR